MGGFIIEAVVGPKGSTKLLDALSEASSTVRRVRQAVGGLKTVFRGATVGPAKRLSISAARQLADVGYNSRVVRGALESVTAVRQRAVTRVLRDLDTAGSALSDANQRALSRLVTRLDVDAETTRVLRRFDDEGRLDDLTSVVRCSAGRGSISPSIAVAGGAAALTGTYGSASSPSLATTAPPVSRCRPRLPACPS